MMIIMLQKTAALCIVWDFLKVKNIDAVGELP